MPRKHLTEDMVNAMRIDLDELYEQTSDIPFLHSTLRSFFNCLDEDHHETVLIGHMFEILEDLVKEVIRLRKAEEALFVLAAKETPSSFSTDDFEDLSEDEEEEEMALPIPGSAEDMV